VYPEGINFIQWGTDIALYWNTEWYLHEILLRRGCWSMLIVRSVRVISVINGNELNRSVRVLANMFQRVFRSAKLYSVGHWYRFAWKHWTVSKCNSVRAWLLIYAKCQIGTHQSDR